MKDRKKGNEKRSDRGEGNTGEREKGRYAEKTDLKRKTNVI